MDLMIFSDCKQVSKCEGSKPSKTHHGSGEDTPPFDMVLHQEEEKMSSEAEALMLAMLQKSPLNQASDQLQGTSSSDASVSKNLVPNSLVETGLQTGMQIAGQTATVTEQVDGVGPSQAVEVDLVKTEVKPENLQKIIGTTASAEQTTPTLVDSKPISVQALSAEPVDLENLEIDPKIVKTEAETKQRVDQTAKMVVEPQGGNGVKTATGEAVIQQETADPKTVETNAKDIEFAKVQVDQMTKSTTINEPARMAEAQPRQTINQVSEQIEMMFQQGRSSLRLQLTPENLGRIDIRLVNSGQGIGITVLTEQSETGKLLEAQLEQLRQTLQDAGIQLSHLNIGQQSQGSKNPWQMQEQKGRPVSSVSLGKQVDEQEIVANPTRLRTETGVDYRV